MVSLPNPLWYFYLKHFTILYINYYGEHVELQTLFCNVFGYHFEIARNIDTTFPSKCLVVKALLTKCSGIT